MCSKIDIMNKVILSLLAIILMISACKNDPKGAQQMPPEATDPARSGEAYSMTLDGKKLMEWNEPAEIKAKNDGWQIPDINFNNLFRRGVKVPDPLNPGSTYNDNRYKKWRYENYNLTIGISYPF